MKKFIATLAALLLFGEVSATAVTSIPNKTVVQGPAGQSLSVSKAKGLNPKGATVTVIGRGFDTNVGIYVALCVMPTPGKMPGPCGGGVDMDGSTSASKWISSNPPAYGVDLAIPYNTGGNFKVKLKFNSKIGKFNCKKVTCAITTRADHLQSDDRSADVFIPIKFK